MLTPSGLIELPEHAQPGGFDHADIHPASRKLYVAHTCNNALDVIDCAAGRYSQPAPVLRMRRRAVADPGTAGWRNPI